MENKVKRPIKATKSGLNRLLREVERAKIVDEAFEAYRQYEQRPKLKLIKGGK